ncbi:MAG: universal stress protein [bacterium]|nr:universal stress protein [bacterium]
MSAPHILLTTDRSDEALRAFAPVAKLAAALQARVTILNVVLNQSVLVAPASAAMPQMNLDPEQAAAEAQKDLATLRERLPGVADVTVEAVVGVDVADTIVDRAKADGADYICMATHGHSGIKRLLLGSVAEKVVRHTTVPVLLYPPAE